MFGVWTVVRRSAGKSTVLRNVAVYAGLLLIVLPFLIRMSNIHYGMEVEVDKESYDATYFAGVDGFQTTLLFFLLTLVVGAVFLVVTGNLDLGQLKSKASSYQNNQQGYGSRATASRATASRATSRAATRSRAATPSRATSRAATASRATASRAGSSRSRVPHGTSRAGSSPQQGG